MRRFWPLALLIVVVLALGLWAASRNHNAAGTGAQVDPPPIEAPQPQPAESEPAIPDVPKAAVAAPPPTHEAEAQAQTPDPPLTVVIWISVDGLRGDYIDTADAPFLERFLLEGAYSRELIPVFPSLTFPSHVSQCTGAPVRDHGIIANALYDIENDRRWSYPNDNSAILCEPIWNTASRQGRRTAVFDWPVSQKQTGPSAAAYCTQSYNTSLSDQQRLEQLWDAWARDREPQPLQLLMGYFPGVDNAGHKYGPNSSEAKHAVKEADDLLAESFHLCEQQIRQNYGDNVVWYFIVSTDHGMEDIHTLVSLRGLLGDAHTDDVRSVTSGSAGNIFLDFITDPEARVALRELMLERLNRHEFVHAYAREDLPADWAYDCPGRTGDIVVSIDPGYFFSEGPGPPVRPVDPSEGPLGMHGYPLADCPQMHGFLGIWRSGEPIGGVDLGPVDSLRLHATVADLLDIAPAPTALNDPLPNLRP
jgi:hypothetical protein